MSFRPAHSIPSKLHASAQTYCSTDQGSPQHILSRRSALGQLGSSLVLASAVGPLTHSQALASGVYNSHAVGVWYTREGRWAIFNQDRTPMPVGVTFHVEVTQPRADHIVHQARSENISGNFTLIDAPYFNGQPLRYPMVTPNYNPSGTGGTYNNHPIGAWYTRGRWAIFNQDLAPMPVGAAFNVSWPKPYVHRVTAANLSGNYTRIDYTNPPGVGLVFVTPAWSEATGGVYNNHPIGVFFTGRSWAIFNQDRAPMPLDAIFHVRDESVRADVPDQFQHEATVSNTKNNWTTIDHPTANGNPNAMLFVTPSW